MCEAIEDLYDKFCKLELQVKYLEEDAKGEHVNLYFSRLSKTAQNPTKAYDEDAGWDLYADEDVELVYGKPTVIKTNIAFEFPKYYHGLIWDRSSMGKKGIKVYGGMIDNGYRGSVDVVLLYGDSDALSIDYGHDYDYYYRVYLSRESVKINRGDKIAQIVLVKMPISYLHEKDELNITERGSKGFGSSGK